MDYKYIEQLVERYFRAETSEAEEQILRAFFRQADVPAPLARWRPLFAYEAEAASDGVSSDFERRVLERIAAEEPVRARRLTLHRAMRPLFQAAAAVAIVVLVGLGAQRSFSTSGHSAWDYNPATYQDTYDSPRQAYHVVEDGLEMFQKTAVVDSLSGKPATDAERLQK